MKKIILLCLFIMYTSSHSFFNPLPVIETTHLILRNCTEADAPDLFEVHGDPEGVTKYTPMETDANVERTLSWIKWRLQRQAQNLPAPWALEHKADKKVIGLCGFYTFDEKNKCASLLVTFNRSYDYALITQAVDAALDHGFTIMNLNRIDFYINPAQINAVKICEQYTTKGLRRIGIIPDCLYYKGAFCDRILYCMLKKDWR